METTVLTRERGAGSLVASLICTMSEKKKDKKDKKEKKRELEDDDDEAAGSKKIRLVSPSHGASSRDLS